MAKMDHEPWQILSRAWALVATQMRTRRRPSSWGVGTLPHGPLGWCSLPCVRLPVHEAQRSGRALE